MEKEKELRFLVTPYFFKSLQDGLAPWALKLLEIFSNCKKLNIN